MPTTPVSGAIYVRTMDASIGEGSAVFTRNHAGGNGGKGGRSRFGDDTHPPSVAGVAPSTVLAQHD